MYVSDSDGDDDDDDDDAVVVLVLLLLDDKIRTKRGTSWSKSAAGISVGPSSTILRMVISAPSDALEK